MGLENSTSHASIPQSVMELVTHPFTCGIGTTTCGLSSTKDLDPFGDKDHDML